MKKVHSCPVVGHSSSSLSKHEATTPLLSWLDRSAIPWVSQLDCRLMQQSGQKRGGQKRPIQWALNTGRLWQPIVGFDSDTLAGRSREKIAIRLAASQFVGRRPGQSKELGEQDTLVPKVQMAREPWAALSSRKPTSALSTAHESRPESRTGNREPD